MKIYIALPSVSEETPGALYSKSCNKKCQSGKDTNVIKDRNMKNTT